MTNFYSIGKRSLKDFISHRILLHPSKLLHTMSDIKTVKVRSAEQDSKIVTMCMQKKIAHSIKTGQPIKYFEQFISNPCAICNADGSMYHCDTKSYFTKNLINRHNENECFLTPTLPVNW